MRGIFCSTNAQTNEEYREIIKSRMWIWVSFTVLGCITLAAALFGSQLFQVGINGRMKAFYCGVGTGFVFGGIVMWIKGKRLLGDEEKLKEERLRDTDERQVEIGNKAVIASTKALLAALYLICCIGGLFYPIMLKILCGLVLVFVVAYTVSFRVYESKM